MAAINQDILRAQLETRKQRLDAAMARAGRNGEFERLMHEVDHALERMEEGTFGICESCHEHVGDEWLRVNPLAKYCIEHLNLEQQRELQADLDMASHIQRGLLPKPDVKMDGWELHFHYAPAGPVSGDYCDVIPPANGGGDSYFLLGDVSGHGVAASMLMTQLHATFRSLVSLGLPVNKLVETANRIFCESVPTGQYATLVCGRANRSGEVEISNAGHLPVLAVQSGKVARLGATSVPLGMFCLGNFPVQKIQLGAGDSLVLFTDGLSEARNARDAEYGIARLTNLVGQRHTLSPSALVEACLSDVKTFSNGAARADDQTLMVLRRAA
ncbi:MAG: SpoIIE family protein phosphatase [Acidobacteria bacterium]|nr:SpoIIE family protein phosphatase [Acidobacteriota bacterium]